MEEEIIEFKCNFEGCNASYKWRTSLNRHKNNVHKNLRYMCEVCGKVFTTKRQMMLHQKKCIPSQPETPVESEPLPIKKIFVQANQEVFQENISMNNY